jgi:hypothetical protein
MPVEQYKHEHPLDKESVDAALEADHSENPKRE